MAFAKPCFQLIRTLVTRPSRIPVLLRNVRDQLDGFEDPIVTPWNFKLGGSPGMADGGFEHTETKLIRSILADVDVLVNVGANIGYYCCHALSMGIKVIAFEPIDRNLRCLCQNIKINGWSGAEIYPIALSDRVGVLEIYGSHTGASVVKGWAGISADHVTLVPSSTMDVVLGSRLRGKRVLVVADIEGAEKWMLEGATLMLANDPKPIWVVEIATKEHQPSGVVVNPNLKGTFQIFFQNGYQAFAINREMTPVTMEQVESVANNSLAFGTYNFLFSESKPNCKLP